MVEPNTTVSDAARKTERITWSSLIIDNCRSWFPSITTILMRPTTSIQIPTLCYLRDLNEIGGCRVCVVEVEGCDQLVAACNNPLRA